MAFQTNVFVDGQWTTRSVDLHTVLQNQQEPPTLGLVEQVTETRPTLGVLTRTILPSPIINKIIQARIRSKDKNDVVLIGVCLMQLFCPHSEVSALQG
jgi:hypothetical protein